MNKSIPLWVTSRNGTKGFTDQLVHGTSSQTRFLGKNLWFANGFHETNSNDVSGEQVRWTMWQKKKKKKEETYPAIFKREDLVASSPQSITVRPMTSWINGFTVWRASLGPPIAKTSFPVIAIPWPPKTGAQRKVAFLSFSSEDVAPMVSGCTVEQSTKILLLRDWPDEIADEMSFRRTSSLDTCHAVEVSFLSFFLSFGQYWIPYHGEDDSTFAHESLKARLWCGT